MAIGELGVVALLALITAILLNQSSTSIHRQGFASTAELARETERIQWVSDNAKAESRRLTAATQTLQNDRDRLFARVTQVEQTLAAVQSLATTQAANVEQKSSSKSDSPSTDAAPAKIADKAQDRQGKTQDKAEDAAPAAEAKPVVAATATPKPTPPQTADNSAVATASPPAPQPAVQASTQAPDTIVTGSIDKNAPAAPATSVSSSATASSDAAESTVEQTKFGIDLGTASSMQALRVFWGTMQKSNKGLLAQLRPILVIKEGGNGLGMQLHLVAGPLSDAAAATQLCAALAIRNYACDTAVFDGQRLSMDNLEVEAEHSVAPTPAPVSVKRKKETRRRIVVVRPQPQPQPQQPEPSAFARFVGR